MARATGQHDSAYPEQHNLVRRQIVNFATDLRLRADWHEPDEQGVTAKVTGSKLDNAFGDAPGKGELVVHLCCQGGEITVNLASLLADYCTLAREKEGIPLRR